MLSIRSARDRGQPSIAGGPDHHSFSFADYYDPKFNGFRNLRVLNEDRIAPAQGFAPHPHRDMEIITYVLEGSLEYRDSLGNGGILGPGEVQHISPAAGFVTASSTIPEPNRCTFSKIWLLPNQNGVVPYHAQ